MNIKNYFINNSCQWKIIKNIIECTLYLLIIMSNIFSEKIMHSQIIFCFMISSVKNVTVGYLILFARRYVNIFIEFLYLFAWQSIKRYKVFGYFLFSWWIKINHRIVHEDQSKSQVELKGGKELIHFKYFDWLVTSP